MSRAATSLDARLRLSRPGFELDIELRAEPGRTLAVVGPNGAGKSRTLDVIAGVEPHGGRIAIGDRHIDPVPIEHRRVGYVFQDYLLFPHLTVRQNVEFGPRSIGTRAAAAREVADGWLDRLGLADLATRRPRELSGGQAQRVALARALAVEPKVLLLDEPLAALDAELRPGVRAELAAHLAEWGGITVIVTHAWDDVLALAADVVVLERGSITQRGTVPDLARNPATDYVARLVS